MASRFHLSESQKHYNPPIPNPPIFIIKKKDHKLLLILFCHFIIVLYLTPLIWYLNQFKGGKEMV
jgi:hypothetical protein